MELLLLIILFILFIIYLRLDIIVNLKNKFISTPLIYLYYKIFNIDLKEYKKEKITEYNSFNEFFTREIKQRVIENGIISPVDGEILSNGIIKSDTIIQCKGTHYSISKLLKSKQFNNQLINGKYINIYLSPKDYHRVHMPINGELVNSYHIDGKHSSVNKLKVSYFNGIYDTNERVVLEYNINGNLLLIILVGAKMVNSIDYHNEKKIYIKGDEIGKFNFGSTVIMLFDSNFNIPFVDNKKVTMGKDLF